MNKFILLIFVLCNFQFIAAQEIDHKHQSDLRLSLTIEPLNYLSKGHSVWLGLRYKQLSFGVVTFSAHSKTNVLFDQHENLDIKLQKGRAFFARVYLSKKPSSPFVGYLLGTEQWHIQNKTNPKSQHTFKNAFFTPQIGYQLSALNNRLIINPNIRCIIPFNPSGPTELDGMKHELKSMAFIPGLDLGLGIPFK